MAMMPQDPIHSAASEVRYAPLRPVQLGSREVDIEQRDGCSYMRLREPLGEYPRCITDRLAHWAAMAPERAFLMQPQDDGRWQELRYGQALQQVRCIGQWLLDAGLSTHRPLMILSENSIAHALLGLAAMHVGVPYVPVSPAYSLAMGSLDRLRHVVALTQPGAVFAGSASRYDRALATELAKVPAIVGDAPLPGTSATRMQQLLATAPTAAVDAAHAAVHADTLAKILFTSGTTGLPKGVRFPQRMICSNCQQVAQAMAFLQQEPPVMVDWPPWHHTFGGNHNFGIALYNGGTFYIDPGRPQPQGIEATVQLLRRVAPTLYLNSPQGFHALLPYLREDEALRRNFFSRLQLIQYGAARLPEYLWQAYDELSVATLGQRVLITSGIGCTEAGPAPTFTPWDPQRAAAAGVPTAGVEIKLAPVNDKLELRLRGPCVTPGYWQDDERTRAAFDEEGFYRSGDAVLFVDPADPHRGLRYDCRIGDNFKLGSGSWVQVAELRNRVLSAGGPYVKDVVIAGHDRDYVSALVFPDFAGLRSLHEGLAELDDATLLAAPAVRECLQTLADTLMLQAHGGTDRILRLAPQMEPATLENGELSDKSAINFRAALKRRAQSVEALYADPPAAWLIVARAASANPPDTEKTS